MQLEVSINGRSGDDGRYISWAPAPCRVRVTAPEGANAPVAITVRNQALAGGGEVVFYANGAAAAPSLQLVLPVDGTPIDFEIGGKFRAASTRDRDTALVIEAAGVELARVPLMVRVRKDAQTLTDDERARFVAALAQLNDRGAGPFRLFREMHTSQAIDEAHGRPGFLPWHRAYLLDLERNLQAIDRSVALPYWRFDAAAPRLFDPAFLGRSDSNGAVHFAASNPLQFWSTDGVVGVARRPRFDTATEPAQRSDGPVLTESETLALGDAYVQFLDLEQQPHGWAHVCFGGSISSIGTAARDPLFFLLHANVDRLWAKWQWLFHRFDPAVPQAFTPANRIGHNLPDTMWPWNEVVVPPRPPVAPGGPLEDSVLVTAPGPQPRVRDTLDLQGRTSRQSRLGFDYDDVPFD
jgi:tyrosinase